MSQRTNEADIAAVTESVRAYLRREHGGRRGAKGRQPPDWTWVTDHRNRSPRDIWPVSPRVGPGLPDPSGVGCSGP
jgi:hypothetical protein